MGNFLSQLLGGPGKSLLDGVKGVIDQFVASPQEKATAQLAIAKLETDYQLQAMQLDQKWAETQASVITAEVKSDSMLARNWRPILMLTFTYIVAHNFVIAPLFHVPSVPIPPDMWDLLKIGMGGYIVGRSAEKIVPPMLAAKAASK